MSHTQVPPACLPTLVPRKEGREGTLSKPRCQPRHRDPGATAEERQDAPSLAQGSARLSRGFATSPEISPQASL